MKDLINILSEIHFAYPAMLFGLILLPLLIVYYIFSHKDHSPDIRYVHSAFAEEVKMSLRTRMRHIPMILRMLALTMLIIALARPQSSSRIHEISVEGIDIMIALDISGSMLAEDFQPNRMEAAKLTAIEFIDLRPNDRIGMTVFSGESFTLCPLTTDHRLLKELASGVTTGMVQDGTAIGDGLATAINGLRDSDAISRVIVLLTDGINNTGVIDPLTAAEMAALFGIRVYTIGVGSSGLVPYPFPTPFGIQYRDVEIPVDEDLLREIADKTGGKYYWAETQDALENVYEDIDRLERSIIEHTEFTMNTDEYLPLLLLAIMFFSAEIVLRYTWLRSVP